MFTRPTTYNWSASKQWFIPASRAPPPPPVSVEGDLALNLPGKKTFGRIFFSAKSRSLGSHGRRVFWCEVCLRSRKAVAYPRTGRMSCIFPLFCFTFFRLLFFFSLFSSFFSKLHCQDLEAEIRPERSIIRNIFSCFPCTPICQRHLRVHLQIHQLFLFFFFLLFLSF